MIDIQLSIYLEQSAMSSRKLYDKGASTFFLFFSSLFIQLQSYMINFTITRETKEGVRGMSDGGSFMGFINVVK